MVTAYVITRQELRDEHYYKSVCVVALSAEEAKRELARLAEECLVETNKEPWRKNKPASIIATDSYTCVGDAQFEIVEAPLVEHK
jgi:hypothetical protein